MKLSPPFLLDGGGLCYVIGYLQLYGSVHKDKSLKYEVIFNGTSREIRKNVRMSYSRIDEVIDMPNLIEIQKNSYNQFLKRV